MVMATRRSRDVFVLCRRAKEMWKQVRWCFLCLTFLVGCDVKPIVISVYAGPSRRPVSNARVETVSSRMFHFGLLDKEGERSHGWTDDNGEVVLNITMGCGQDVWVEADGHQKQGSRFLNPWEGPAGCVQLLINGSDPGTLEVCVRRAMDKDAM